MTRPTRRDQSGRAFLDLQNLAKRHGRDTGELLTIYALEGFLARLAASPRAGEFVLKGGVLLAAYNARRPTRDIDLLATALSNDLTVALAAVCEVARIDLDDGLQYDTDAATAETIRDEDEYTGIRVAITARLATAILPIHIDINVGDPVSPPAGPIALPCLLGGAITITGYPIAMVHAEKIVTAIQRGSVNTRWRDFADIYLLSSRQPVAGVYAGVLVQQRRTSRNPESRTPQAHRDRTRAPHGRPGWSPRPRPRWRSRPSPYPAPGRVDSSTAGSDLDSAAVGRRR